MLYTSLAVLERLSVLQGTVSTAVFSAHLSRHALRLTSGTANSRLIIDRHFYSSCIQPYPRRRLSCGSWSSNFVTTYPSNALHSVCNSWCPQTLPVLIHSRHMSSTNNANGRTSSHKARLRIVIIAVIVLHLLIVAARYDFQRSKEAKQHLESVEIYRDPDCSKGAGTMVRLSGFWLPHFALNVIDDVRRLPVKDDDVIIASFPKSGTTWVQHLTYLLSQKAGLDTPLEGNIESRFPYLEYIYPGIKEIKKLTGRRFLKTHLPYSLLPADIEKDKGKVIYIARNPKDVSVSYFHFTRMISELNYTGDFNNFYNKFILDKVPYAPWWKHVKEYQNHSCDKNLLYITYEELQKDPKACIRKIASFLGYKLSDKDITAIASEASFTKMQDNPETNYSWWDDLGLRKKCESHFMRKGRVGDWKNYYTAEMSERVDDWYQKHLSDTTLLGMDDAEKCGTSMASRGPTTVALTLPLPTISVKER